MNAAQREQVIAVAKKYYPGDKEIVNEPAIQMIQEHLAEGEMPQACMLSGISLKNKDRIGESGSLWATDQRLIYVGLRSLFAKQVIMIEFAYPQISDFVAQKGGLMGLGSFKVMFKYDKTPYIFMGSKTSTMVEEFVEQVNFLMHGGTKASSGEDQDISVQLERLTQLRSQGALTEAEFTAAKEKILQA